MAKSKEEKTKKHKTKKDDSAKWQEQIDALQKEKDEVFEKLQRVSADYANFQKRSSKQIADSITYEKERIIKTLLPVLDNFEHSLQNAPSSDSTEAIFKGIKIVYDQLLEILKFHQVEQIDSLGEKFDPAFHQAMMQRSEPEKADGIVLEEFQKGYKLNGRVIRPSKVIVNKIQDENTVDECETTDTE